jgi:drug/metabolite transporter (DMT)-like permease
LASVLSLGAVIAISLSTVYVKQDAHQYDAFSLTVVQMVLGAVMLAIVMPLTGGSVGRLSGRAWLLILFLAVVATVIPYLAFFWSLQHGSAILVALSGHVAPFVAVAAGILLLGERLQPGIIIGGSLILLGVFATNRAEARSITETIPG